ncbi:MAG: biotin-dependent carboxyltransferase family protein [Candidatus Bathyarchaeota archaeon]|nr:biotin-dependent carboxyltransferase family protein [Candidatus Bathyarchaeota archaeon]MDH5495147.1 biotin-dependent carboxyltransferase family protein [Candidatus Bathyarchaeota archaeon]
MKSCKVIKSGLFTTVQDLGRYGFQRYGVPVSGVMDNYAFVVANLLVGNKPNDACLEMTLLGPELEFINDAQIAITGAAFLPTINGENDAGWQTLHVCNGDVLSFGRLQSGCRAYVAVRGGVDVPVVLGSRSTYVRGGFGGFEGRRLKAGDVIQTYMPSTFLKSGFLMPQELIPCYSNDVMVEVVLGPQSDYFTDRGLETLLSSIYTVTAESDRMGYRLDGAKVEQKDSLNMVSDAIPVGAVQVPRSGKPILVMRDAQTTGGYPKIAVVTTPDVSRLGQAKPNDKIQFSKISPSKARTKLLEHMKTLSQMKGKLIKTGM